MAAHISPNGAPATVYRRWLRRHFDLVTSPALLLKLGEVLARTKFASYTDPTSIASYMWVVRTFSHVVEDPVEISPETGDPEDDRIVALAKHAKSDALVSGDPHITRAKLDIPVFTPAQFLDYLGPEPGEPRL